MNAQLPINHVQFTKFSALTIAVKRNIRHLRLCEGYRMIEGARLLGISRTQLEDIEAIRNYGCHIDIELLAKISILYKTKIDNIVGELPSAIHSEFFQRPRKRKGSKPRKQLS